ncbi:MAG: aminotransferase class I/II-fold pyridoxal phosphate-dependent enzyme [Acidimicrobiales bacterium]|nr:aminotransferase class I/II-fold pyridoxal phosphate-dependent enzyme [Acidimicrobiales bacterium]
MYTAQELTYERARARRSYKWRKFDPDVLPSHVADMDFDPAPEILAEMQGFLDRGDLGYNFFLIPEMFQAYADWQTAHHGWTPDVGRMRSFTSVLHAVEMSIWISTNPGDGVVLFTPSYHPFFDSITGGGRRIVEVPLDPNGWRIDPDRLEAAIDSTTKVILFCQPNNPTGRIFDDDELNAVAAVAERHDLIVISDEIWGDFVHEGPHRPLALADERFAGRLVTMGSASKSFNLAGLHCAVAHIGDRRVEDKLAQLPPRGLGMSTPLSFAAAITAWTRCGEWMKGIAEEVTARRDRVATRLAAEAPSVGFDAPEATYLAWLDFSRTPIADDPAGHLLERARLGIDPGISFGTQSQSFGRLNFATTEQFVDDAIDRIVSLVGD